MHVVRATDTLASLQASGRTGASSKTFGVQAVYIQAIGSAKYNAFWHKRKAVEAVLYAESLSYAMQAAEVLD